MPSTFVAVTAIRHGKEDGTVVTFSEGDEVKGLSKEVLQEYYAAGSITLKGSADDPNELEYPDAPGNTTPAMIQDALQAQARLANSPEGKDSQAFKDALTQGNEKAPSDPNKLLEAQNVGKKAAEETDAQNAGSNVPNPDTATATSTGSEGAKTTSTTTKTSS